MVREPFLRSLPTHHARLTLVFLQGEYVYLNAPVSMLGSEVAKDVPSNFLPDPWQPAMLNTWMGSAGSTAPLHHDPFDNFFIQIYGRKRFILFPPVEHHNLYVYPKTHPRNRQSQVNLDASIDGDVARDTLHTHPAIRHFPDLLKAKGIEVILNPGDTMYLPPFWFHQVESLDDSISINTWYNSPIVVCMLLLCFSSTSSSKVAS